MRLSRKFLHLTELDIGETLRAASLPLGRE